MTQRILVTGGCGFIGANFIRYLLAKQPHCHVINLDAMTYCANGCNLEGIDTSRYTFVHGNICDESLVCKLVASCDAIVHLAAHTHVDRSIDNASPFIETNVRGTGVLLDAVLKNSQKQVRFVYVSTDEVYGQLLLDDHNTTFTEQSPLQPRNPYAATKAAGDLLAQSYHHTHNLDVVITRCSNNLGPYQYPEKIIPLFVTRLMQGKKVPLYGDGKNIRDWIHVDDHCEALLTVLQHAPSGSIYNIAANNQRSNLELTCAILSIMNQNQSMIQYVTDRPGHDKRYALDATKITQQLHFIPSRSAWPAALKDAVQWCIDHPDWWV